jgi:hypothetical protein
MSRTGLEAQPFAAYAKIDMGTASNSVKMA